MDVMAADEPSAVDRVIEAVVSGVREGRFAPGQRLIEAEFTAGLGVSRSVVREAFQRLLADGLLEMERHRGVRVKILSAKDLDDIFAVRIALEGLAAGLAAPAIAAAPEAISACHEAFAGAVARGDVRGFVSLNQRFHALIVQAAANPVLADLSRRLGNTLHHTEFRALPDRAAMDDAVAEHGALLAALVAGDAEGARLAAEDHQRSSLVHLRARHG